MSNILTGLIPDMIEAVDIVIREIQGLLLAVNRDSGIQGLAIGQKAKVPIVPTPVVEDITPGRLPPDTGDQTITYREVEITKQRAAPFRWTGEEQRAMNVPGGTGYRNLRAAQIAQSLRALTNEMEQDVADIVAANGSRAYGTPGTTPFASDLTDAAQIGKILTDNGAPPGDRHLVVPTTTGVNIRKMGQLTKVNEAGSANLLRQGLLIDPILGFNIRESAFLGTHTKGTGTGYVTNLGAPLAIGATSIAVDTGSGTVVAGDTVTFAGDTNKYVVKTGIAAPGTIVIGGPGLRQALADGVAMTIGNSYTINAGFSRNALALATRLPAMPEELEGGGQRGILLDREVIVDATTGLAFEFTVWGGHYQVRYQVGAVWGVAPVKPEWMAILLG